MIKLNIYHILLYDYFVCLHERYIYKYILREDNTLFNYVINVV